jgi:hypothetical protein
MSVRKMAPTPAPPVQPLGIRYSVREAQGSSPQLTIESNADGTVYLFRRTAAGEWAPVTPGGMSVKAHAAATTALIPLDGDAPLPRVLLVLSRTPVAELAQTGAELTATLERMRMRSASAMTDTASGSTFVVAQPVSVQPLVVPIALP